jgi:hypothetical protein
MTHTSVAVLGTLTEFHDDPIPYDLSTLIDLVSKINPDLLCLDMTMDQWLRQDFSHLPPEYRDALLPLAYQTDMVVAPIAGSRPPEKLNVAGWRGFLIRQIRRMLTWMQQTAPGPDAMNQGWRHDWGNALYEIIRKLAGHQVQQTYHERIETLTQAVVNVAENNPDNRILIVTNIQYCHHIRPRLKQLSDVQVTTYSDL